MSKINIIADTHNVPALEKILKKLNKVISLGDIASVDTKEYFLNIKRYSALWKAYKNNFPDFSKADKDWFENLNREGWKLQMENIKRNAKDFKVLMGNSDEYMIKYIPKVKEFLEETQTKNKTFRFKDKIDLENLDNIQLLFLPFRKESFISDIKQIENNLDISKTLFVLGHVPPYKDHQKQYYIMHNEALEYLNNLIKNHFYYFHGHIHSDKTYKYSIPNVSNLTIITPKAPDTKYGINWDHDFVEIDTNTAKMNLYSISTGKKTIFLNLPKGYREREDHWNDFKY